MEIEARRPRNGDFVVCGASGMPTCADPGQLSKIDEMALDKAETIRKATLNAGGKGHYEYGFGIKETADGSLAYATDKKGNIIQTSKSNEHVDLKFDLAAGEKLVATVHSHPDVLNGQYFSGWDVNQTKAGQLNYMVNARGAVLRYDPDSYSVATIRSVAPRLGGGVQVDFNDLYK